MLPSLLAHEIQKGLKQFLISGFEPSDSFFHGVISRFVDDESQWLKGPYLQAGLPFRVGSQGKKYFGHFELTYPGYTHQEAAWVRLCSNRLAANTLVATGTGSGKTECFLYPLLDHCTREHQSGNTQGIKALVIYPMNALATDQARRFAETIAQTPEFAGLRVGLFVGGRLGDPGSGMVMTPTSVITDRDTLRKQPPDILLTNYKMLDYLLVRPKDRQLWANNKPTTLRYVVVDELHTFDGAQGTDLALLLRRLTKRLNAPAGHLICAGTSATLGGATDTSPLREYARQVFGCPFPDDSVITENRYSIDEFLGDAVIEHVFQSRDDFATVLDPGSYSSPSAAIAAWFQVFFPGLPTPSDVNDSGWRANLGTQLKKHLLTVNLLKLLKNQTKSLPDLIEQIQGPLPQSARPYARQVLDALLALMAWAREPDGSGRALVTLRVQIWMRELRRMVAKVSANAPLVQLKAAASLKAKPDGMFLPLIQCSECHTTGWLGRKPENSSKVQTDLESIYNTWFSGRSEIARIYPKGNLIQPMCEGVMQHLCTECGHMQHSAASCQACGGREILEVFRVTGTRNTVQGQVAYTWHDRTCPACGTRDRLILLGARNATLGAQIIEQSWASPFNDDKKLIAFSDSVQDAAHRAGFFSARTYLNNVRTATTKVINHLAKPSVAWNAFLAQLPDVWLDPSWPYHMDKETFVAEFIGPNMLWQRDWEHLLDNGVLPSGSQLPLKVKKRLAWQVFSEFTYLSQRGRSLERIGLAALTPDTELIDRSAKELLPLLHEHYGLRHLSEQQLFWWLWGFLAHLRRRGGVWHPEADGYAKDARVWALANGQGRGDWMPSMGEQTPRPIFLTLGQHKGFDRLTNDRKNWYEQWLLRTLNAEGLIQSNATVDLYQEAIKVLTANNVLVITDSPLGKSVAINPDVLQLHTDVVRLVSAQGKRSLTVSAALVGRLEGMPCLDARSESYSSAIDDPNWLVKRFVQGDIRRVIAAEHTGLLERDIRESLELRFKAKTKDTRPWFENLLSATPTLEMGVDIGDLSSVMLCSVPPNQASFLQRIGRAGRRDGNAIALTLADGSSPHDLYFFEETDEMLAGEVTPPGVFLKASEVLRRQLFAFCLDDWVGSGISEKALPDKTSRALDALDSADLTKFPYTFLGYVQSNQNRLLREFLALLTPDADQRVVDRLTEYMEGRGDGDGLRIRLQKALEELAKERAVHKKRANDNKKRIQTLQAKPQDEATKVEIESLQLERDKALQLAAEINSRELLNTLTDAGLIPNYAFPEAGVQLKSLLWRRKGNDEQAATNYITLPPLKYERPAASALSEFAPENRFYANQRRVEVDQIDMQLAKVEDWRLCPSCHHMESLTEVADSHANCPRCGDGMWGNLSQRRTLLRFKQAIANSNDREVRIDDSADDREPKFYIRQLLVDFDPSDIEIAWKLKTGDLPFGFEFLHKATFRDINFGEISKPGETFKIADIETTRPGFKLCRHCGMVQRPLSRGNNASETQQHAFDCDKRVLNDPVSIIDCLYLYREFSSEALRILVPYTTSGVDDEVIQSFMAAIQLGLKLRFGGKVDHLRMTTHDEPGVNGTPKRRYVLLYDSVPGGTGYLHQLLSQHAQTLGDVLKLAYQHLIDCGCNQDVDKDGCYRCVYQYRWGRAMDLVSRDRAKEVLGELTGSLDQLEKVSSVSDIYINPNFDSVLEPRFIESLRRLGGQNGLPPVKLVQDIVKGKSGYLLEVGDQRYWIEPQVSLDSTDGVKAASKPDFVFWPVQSSSPRRPIAVFCDGWTYHQFSLREDARKRTALVNSGEFWVCSVTWEDVKAALDGGVQTELESPTVAHAQHVGNSALQNILKPNLQVFSLNAVALLLAWLAKPATGQDDPFATQLYRNAAWLTFLMVPPPNSPASSQVAKEIADSWTLLPDWMQSPPQPSTAAGSKGNSHPSILYWWPAQFAKGKLDGILTPGVLMLDDGAEIAEAEQHVRWKAWIALFNHLQVMKGMLLATRSGVEGNDYIDLMPVSAKAASSAQAITVSSGWEEVAEQVVDTIKDAVLVLADLGVQPPDEVGFELASDKGDIIAEAELAWAKKQVVVLLESQFEYQSVWADRGWQVIRCEDGWPQAVQQALA